MYEGFHKAELLAEKLGAEISKTLESQPTRGWVGFSPCALPALSGTSAGWRVGSGGGKGEQRRVEAMVCSPHSAITSFISYRLLVEMPGFSGMFIDLCANILGMLNSLLTFRRVTLHRDYKI